MQLRYNKNTPASIKELFNSIAPRYDLGNAMLSFGMHYFWNRCLSKTVMKCHPSSVLDLCCGTGAIGQQLLNRHKRTSNQDPLTLYCLDFSSEMLKCAKQRFAKIKGHPAQIHYYEADAQHIPISSSLIDASTIAYGIRNIRAPVKALQEVYRVLKPGGSLAILELTRPNSKILSSLHHIYLNQVVPKIGKVFTQNAQAYQYLTESIHHFIPASQLAELMQQAGFTQIQVTPLSGGIATLITGHKTTTLS